MTRARIDGLPVPFDWEAKFRKTPSPVEVARLWITHGSEAAAERWLWMSDRKLYALAREGGVVFDKVMNDNHRQGARKPKLTAA